MNRRPSVLVLHGALAFATSALAVGALKVGNPTTNPLGVGAGDNPFLLDAQAG